MPRQEVFVGSLTTRSGDNLSLTRVLEAEAVRGKITEVHAVLGEKQNGYDILSQVADIAFGFNIEPTDIKANSFSIEPSDHFFAKEFGYVILPIACAKLIKDKVEAWISPALVSKEHPLAQVKKEDNAVVISTIKIDEVRIDPMTEFFQILELSEQDRENVLRSILVGAGTEVLKETVGTDDIDAIVSRYFKNLRASPSSHYVRLTVQDDPGVLALVAEQFGNAKVSIRMAMQPEVKEESKIAQVAFILYPCDTKALEKSAASIQNLDVCLGVGNVLKVVE